MSEMAEYKAHKGVVGVSILAVAIFLIVAFLTQPEKQMVDANDEAVVVYSLPETQKKPQPILPEISHAQAFDVAMAYTYRHNAERVKPVALERGDHNQAKLAAEIFDLQSQGDMKAANRILSRLHNKNLRGHVLADRYLGAYYKTSFAELQNWMNHYADYPQAARIYKLAQAKRGNKKADVPQPVTRKLLTGNLATHDYQGKIYQTRQKRTKTQAQAYLNLKNAVRNHVQEKEPTQALHKINAKESKNLMDNVEYDRLRADIAAGYFYAGNNKDALRLASKSLKRSDDKAPMAGWVSGLVNWQKGNYGAAARSFEKTAKSAYASAWLKTAAAYWASRAHSRLKNKKKVHYWTEQATEYPRTFYGVLATYILDQDNHYNWDVPAFTKSHAEALNGNVIAKRAYLLVIAGRDDLAEEELFRLNVGANYKLREAIVAFAHHYNLAALSFRIANAWKPAKHKLYDAALYPDTNWQPYGGYKVDRALVNAVIRQESKFQHAAQNASGATGLMQVMPRTARYISSKDTDVVEKALGYLHHPSVNMEFGQSYLKYLLNHPAVGQDLFSLFMAYNAGPGTLSKWKREREHITDPLLFIESIPFHETRAFVDRVMANYWLYRMCFDQNIPSLKQVAKGEWPRYIAQDGDVSKLAMLLSAQ